MFSIFRDNRDDLQDLSGFPLVERTSFQLYHWLNYDSSSFINLAQLIPLQVTRLGRTMRPCWGLLEKNVNDINVALTILKERMMQQIFVCVRAKCQSGRSPTRFLWHKLESFFSTQDGMQGHPGSSHRYPFISIESGCNDALWDLVKCFAHDYTTLVSIWIPKHWPLGQSVSVSVKSNEPKNGKLNLKN